MARWPWSIYVTLTCALALVMVTVSASNPTTRPSKGMEGRVVGGTISRANQFPYLISIGDAKQEGNHMYGESLIKENLVFTAAHCFFYPGTSKPLAVDGMTFRLTAGEHSLTKIDGTEQVANLSRLVVHKDYSQFDFVNDIALVELNKLFKLTTAVKIIKLANSRNKYRPSNCTVSGWGYTKPLTNDEKRQVNTAPKDGWPDTPQWVEWVRNIINKDECSKLLLVDQQVTVSHPSTICVGKLAGGQSSCSGDSGGPFVCPSDGRGPGSSVEPLQVGIVSSSPACAIANMTATDTSVAFMEPWLKKAESALPGETSKDTSIIHGILFVK